jgi:diguanylate cyclase (GGDEF)-like protein
MPASESLAPALPLGAFALTLLLAISATGVSVWAGQHAWRAQRMFGAGVGAMISMAAIGVWAQAVNWNLSEGLLFATAVGAVVSQTVLGWLVARWRNLLADRSAVSAACAALVPVVAAVLSWAALGAVLAAPSGAATGLELLLGALAVVMVGLGLHAEKPQRPPRAARRSVDIDLEASQPDPQAAPVNDPLTGLLSRLGIEAKLRRAAAQAEARAERVALLFIGLDGFKSVNDSYGHALGDSVLQQVAQRLADETLNLDPGRHAPPCIARVGGDEFVLMLQGPLDRQSLARAANRVLEVLDGPIRCDEDELKLSASVGIACFPEDGGSSKLIARANAAMQAAKAAGGSTYICFEPRMQDDVRERNELLRDLRQAVEGKQLELFYQPKIDARSGQVTAAEALLRWHHPTRGTIPPSVFIPLAERHGLIGALGNWVIEDACRQARVWRERGLKMRLAINLSVFQMRQNDLVERIQAALKRHGVNPSRLTCEITESVAMEDTQVTQRTFERLGQAGIHLSIDDFGTGYSSLAYLRRLPATELKIDRSFVSDLETSADARAIVDAVLKLAHAIGLKVVAEGVETTKQRDILLQLGCDEFQGYLFARPMSARALMLWAVDDKPARNAFRASLFAETETPTTMEAAKSSQEPPHRALKEPASAKGC